jgi:hypothetical protein
VLVGDTRVLKAKQTSCSDGPIPLSTLATVGERKGALRSARLATLAGSGLAAFKNEACQTDMKCVRAPGFFRSNPLQRAREPEASLKLLDFGST